MSELGADVIALADQAGAERFHIVGHDWGGAVAWAVAAFQPKRVLTLTSLSTPHPLAFRRAFISSAQGLRSWYMALYQVPFVPERLSLVAGGAAFRRTLIASGLDPEKAAEYVDHLGTPEALGAAMNWYRAIGPLTAGAMRRVTVPTLYVWSTGDRFIDRRGADLTARYVDGPYRYEVLDGVSHWIPEEAPGRVAELLLDHLSTHRPGRR